jgi:hypothetical protein
MANETDSARSGRRAAAALFASAAMPASSAVTKPFVNDRTRTGTFAVMMAMALPLPDLAVVRTRKRG